MRNNLITKNLKFTDNDGKNRVAKWDIFQLYELDKHECVIHW